MVKGARTTKIASKNNPAQRRKSLNFKQYLGKDVKPSRYIDYDLGQSYMSAIFIEGGKLAFDSNKNPVKWSEL